MDSKDLIQILKSEPLKFTYDEIEQMMDEELEKDPAEMDTDFIDLCANVLNQAIEANKENESNNKSNNKKHIKIRILKIAAIAAILAITIGIAVPVAAKYVDNDTSDKIVQFYEDHFSINLKDGETDADKHSDKNIDLISKLNKSGFDHIILPNALLADDYTYDVDVMEDENFITALVDFQNTVDKSVISVTITKHKNGIETVLNNDKQVTSEYDSAKQLNINGIDILVFGNKENSTITYIDEHTEYAIDLTNTDFNTAIEIAESIE